MVIRISPDYLYTATLTKEKDGETKEFTIEGEICVVNMLNGWKVDNFKINDTEALRRYITKESLYPQGYEPSGHEAEQLTMDIFLEAVERKQIKSVLWDNFENKQQDNFDTAALNYYVSYHLDYEGKEIRLDFSYNKESQQLENIYPYYTHTYREIVEKVEGLCAPALLVNVDHDLYTIPQLYEMKESGMDIESKETISKYWYLFIAEPGEEYGYVITLNQKNFTKEDILALGKTVQLLK